MALMLSRFHRRLTSDDPKMDGEPHQITDFAMTNETTDRLALWELVSALWQFLSCRDFRSKAKSLGPPGTSAKLVPHEGANCPMVMNIE